MGAVHPEGLPPSNVGTYQYRPPEYFAKGPIYSAAGDIWSLGASFAHFDHREVPFGKPCMRRSEIHAVFFDAAKKVSTWLRPPTFDIMREKANAKTFSALLTRMKTKPASELPWGRKQGVQFQSFLRRLFSMSPEGRPLAAELLTDKYVVK